MILKSEYKNITMMFLLMCFFLIFGCMPPVMISDIKVDSPRSSKIPIRIGLRMTPSFVHYNNLLADGMSKDAERILGLVFEEVVILGFNEMSDPTINVIIIPEIVDEHCNNIPFSTKYGVICKWTIETPSGKTLYVNTIEGVGIDHSFVGNTRFSIAITNAIKDHYQKLLKSLSSSNWWQQIK